MVRCHHHYVYTQGYFYCTRCGKRHYAIHAAKRKIKIGIIIGICIVGIFLGGLYISRNFQEIFNIAIPQETVETIEKSVQKVTEEVTTAFEIKPLDIEAIALKVHDLINEERVLRGLKPLGWHPKLVEAAVNHSNDMATRNYYSHETPEGRDFSYRYSKVGFSCQIPMSASMYSGGAENIMFMEGYYGEDTIAEQAVQGWMESAGHRENILTQYFRNEGIGVAISESGKIYLTQNFC